MDVAALLLELYGRIPPLARDAVEGLDLAQLTDPPAPGSNPIAWLVWHLARVQDHHIAELLDAEQIWVTGGWAPRFGLDPDPTNTGYGHSAQRVASVRPERPEVLLEYLDAVDARTREMLERLDPRRPRPRRGPPLGPAGHARRPPGQRRRRLPATRRAGGLRARA